MESEWANKIQLIRTIERIAAEKLGENQAGQFFRDFSKNYINLSDFEDWKEGQVFWKEISKLAKGIVEEEKLENFVKEMVKGRFEHVEQYNSLSS